MRKFTQCLLVLLLGATPLVAVIETASANSELVPAARLVAPYFDVSGSRSTLLMLTNASKNVDLITTSSGAAFPVTNSSPKGLHIEFYDKNCNRTDRTVDLSAGDVDQLDLRKTPTDFTNDPFIVSKQGFLDIDVRVADAQRDKASLQLNVLLGTVVVSDSASDFVIAYPMASSIGLSDPLVGGTGTGGTIVTHDSNGTAVTWTGRYEAFPSRVFVPFYFAEGGPTSTKSQVVIAAPADGNWANTGVGEAPGAALSSGNLMSGTALFFDACENKTSGFITSHWINSSLGDLFGVNANQSVWNTTKGAACKGSANFPSVDEASSAFIGWVDYPNILASANGFARGMVGVFIQSANKQGDATRLWGDPSGGGVGFTFDVPAAASAGTAGYSLINKVTHNDLNGNL
jgi:hypothetical protein